jgi:hypothetical protein
MSSLCPLGETLSHSQWRKIMSVTFTSGTDAAGSIEDDGPVMSGSLFVQSFGDATYSFRTNGFHGGDSGHGGFAEIGIETSECFITHVAVEVTRNITGPPEPELVYEERRQSGKDRRAGARRCRDRSAGARPRIYRPAAAQRARRDQSGAQPCRCRRRRCRAFGLAPSIAAVRIH